MYSDLHYAQLPGAHAVSHAYVYGFSTCPYYSQARGYGAEPIYPVLEMAGELHFGFDEDIWKSLLLPDS